MAIKNHHVERKERLMVNLAFNFPSPHTNKSYVDKRRHYTIKVDIGEPEVVSEATIIHKELRLRSLVVIKKMFDRKIDSSFTYRVGENFAILRIGDNEIRVSLSFNEDNSLNILDNSMHLLKSQILEITKIPER